MVPGFRASPEGGVREAPRILTVGTTEAWHARIREQLRNAVVETEPTGRDAALRAREAAPDLLIVEAVLPDMTGMAFCRSLREDPVLRPLRVLVLSEQNSELDRVLAFECGADDFLAAPFSARELGARVNALLRRDLGSRLAAPPARPEQHGLLLVDTELGRVEVGGRPVRLTPTELRVFSLLLGGRGKVLTRRTILEGLSGEASSRGGRSVDAHVKALRRKLGDARGYIQSVRGVGYRFSVPER
jgi:two-component system phosphate regulon response regulator PhoB